MSARSFARALGGDACGRYVLCPGPGHSPQDRSLKVSFDPRAPDGFLVHSFAKDGWRECRDYVKDRLGIVSAPGHERGRTYRREVSTEMSAKSFRTSDADYSTRALDLWKEAVVPGGTVVETYLAGRGLALPADTVGAAIRFHPACPFRLKDGTTAKLPAMLGLMRDIITDEPRGVHRTALKPDGSGKAEMSDGTNPKKMLGPSKGAAVKLTSDEDVTAALGIGEGIESALTVLCGGWRPVWAALSAGTIAAFPVLPGVECLTVFADNDASGTGLASAQECQARWGEAGRECDIIMPAGIGRDWNNQC